MEADIVIRTFRDTNLSFNVLQLHTKTQQLDEQLDAMETKYKYSRDAQLASYTGY
jgi:hypothetical protein